MRFILLFLLTSLTAHAHGEYIRIKSSDREISAAIEQAKTSNDGLDEEIDRLINSYGVVSSEEYISPDKRQAVFYNWEYVKIENDFDDNVLKVARLFSNDGNAILFISYKDSDKKYQKPDVGLQLSGSFNGSSWHNFLCVQSCLNIDMNVDGKKHPNISMAYGGGQTLVAKNPKTLLNKIKKGETIKIRLQSITGDPLIYVFEPEQTLELQMLKGLE